MGQPAESLIGSSSSSSSSSTGPTTLLNSSDPYFREFRDLPYHHAITRSVLHHTPSASHDTLHCMLP